MILFKPCSTFDVAYNIYKFDSELRKLIITELEKIEVAVRTQTAYILSSQWDGYWFTDAFHFNNSVRHAKILSKIDEEYQLSDEEGFQIQVFRSFSAKLDNDGDEFFRHIVNSIQ